MPSLTLPLLCEIYFALAIGYNLVSLLRADILERPLAATDPVFGILVMSVFYLIWSAPNVLNTLAWHALVFLYLFLILRFGVIKHLKSYSADGYSSRLSWLCAIAINVFGVGVLATAALV